MNPIKTFRSREVYPDWTCNECGEICVGQFVFNCPFDWEPTLNYPGRYD